MTDVNFKTALQGLMRAIIEEADQNPAFAKKIEAALGIAHSSATPNTKPARRSRRTPAVLDPVDTARQGEAALRQRLVTLTLEQLKDIVADYGMDPGKVMMKWNSADRIINRIVELALSRATKGDVFLK